jgi:hypothetical protein
LDTDMMIKSYDLFNHIQKYVVEEQKAFFPICWSYKDHTHTTGWKRIEGTGNMICLKKDFHPYIEKTTWGEEDGTVYNHFYKLNKAVREFYGENFIHQWHPPNWRKASNR